ncbi:MAG: GIN domain-containing protein [Treponema sp.]
MKTIKNITVLSALLLLTLYVFIGCSTPWSVSGNGNVVARNFNFTGFTKVRVTCLVNVNIVQGDTFKVEVRLDDNLFDYFNVSMKGDTVHVAYKEGLFNLQGYTEAALFVTMPTLHNAYISGSGKTTISGFKQLDNDMTLTNAGVGNMHIDVVANTLHTTLRHFGNIFLKGQAQKLVHTSDGPGLLQAGDFTAEDMNVSCTHRGNAEITVSKSLNAFIDSTGSITAKGVAQNIRVTNSAFGTFKGAGLQTQQAIVDVSGPGTAEVTVQKSLQASISGTGDIIAHGTAEQVQLRSSGIGNLKALDLNAKKAVIECTGSGGAAISVSQELQVTGERRGTTIVYRGSPSRLNVSGNNTVKRIE